MIRFVDVLLATYNGEAYLPILLDSIFNQTYQQFNLIVRDDGSTDGTREILQRYTECYPSRIKILPTGTGQGSTNNFSILLKHAESNYVMFADQDDFWVPEKIALTLAKMEELENEHSKSCPILVHTDLLVADKDLNVVDSSFWRYAKLLPKSCSTLNRLLVQNVVTGCTVMMNRALVNLVQPISPDTIQHDWWIALVAAAFGKIGIVETPTIYYRQHSMNAVGAKKFGIISNISQKISTEEDAKLKYRIKALRQSLAFREQYNHLFDDEQKELVAAYCEKANFSRFPKRIYLTLRYGFYKNGISRNIFSLFS